MFISSWVLQNSSTDPVRAAVAQSNDELQAAILRAWGYLTGEMATNRDFFNLPFHDYLALQYAAVLDASMHGDRTS